MEDVEKSETSESSESRKRSRDEEDGEEKQEDKEGISPKRPNNQATVYFKVLVPTTAAGAIIGKGGETINQLQADTATNIKMSKGGDFFPGTTDRVCMIIGTVENIRKVHNFILDKIKEKPDTSSAVIPGEIKAKFVVPNSTATLIVGKNGENIKTIKDLTDAFIQVSPKSTNTEKPLSERIVTVSGDQMACEKAMDMVLEKIVEDPQSGTCTNVSYTDGPILPHSTMASLFSTNLTSSLHLPVTGHPTMEALKYILRAKGYNEPATREITAALYALASYGFIQLRPPAVPFGGQDWSGSSNEAASNSDYFGQGSEMGTSGSGNTGGNMNQGQDQNNYANYYNNFYGAGGNYGHGYNTGGGYDGNSGYGGGSGGGANYNQFGGMGMGNMPSNYPMNQGPMNQGPMNQGPMNQGPMNQGAYPSANEMYPAGASGGNYSMMPGNYSMPSGGYPGGMMDYSGSGSSSAPPPSGANDGGMTRQEIDVGEHVIHAMMGPEGKGVMELQQWCGATIEIVQKAPFMHTVKIMGPPNSVQSAVYVVQQHIQHAEYRRYYEAQGAQMATNQ